MSEDVIEFGSASAPQVKRAIPLWSASISLLAAIAGAAAGAASLIGTWQLTALPPEVGSRQTGTQELESALPELGPYGAAYLVTLIALITTVAIVHFGQPEARRTARVAGYALAGSSAVMIALLAYQMSQQSLLIRPGMWDPEAISKLQVSLGWGAYAALGAVAALGLALLLHRESAPGTAIHPELEPEMELTVSVEDTGRAHSTGAGHPLYLKP